MIYSCSSLVSRDHVPHSSLTSTKHPTFSNWAALSSLGTSRAPLGAHPGSLYLPRLYLGLASPGGCFGGVRAISQKVVKVVDFTNVRDEWAHVRRFGVHESPKKTSGRDCLTYVLILGEHRFGAVPLNACFSDAVFPFFILLLWFRANKTLQIGAKTEPF